MSYPDFFNKIESIKVKDPLSQLLGAFNDGEYEFSYLEIVKAAGHSCPTVAGAYIITLKALEILYPEQRAVRGNIKVEFKESLEEGVSGVISNVVTHITGATDISGFKGLKGQFSRHSLMYFNVDINTSARFTRIDNGESVDITYSPDLIKPNPIMMELMKKVIVKQATQDELYKFSSLWQDRVKRIFENIDDVVEINNL